MVKIFIRSFFVLTTVLFISPIFGQSIHFSYLDFAPQHVNPGNIGGFLGSYRGAGIYRDQYNNGGQVKGYRTFELGIDLPVIRGFRKQDWIGAGISLNNDTRGSFGLRDVYSRLGLSYHFALDKKQLSSIALGIQMISMNRSMNTNFENGVSPEGLLYGRDNELKEFLMGTGQNGRKSITARDWNVGLVYTQNTKTSNFKLGVSTSGLLPSGLGYKTPADTAGVPFKIMAFAAMVNQMTKTTTLEPTACFKSQSMAAENLCSMLKLDIKSTKRKKTK